jgi:hypothetical protein
MKLLRWYGQAMNVHELKMDVVRTQANDYCNIAGIGLFSAGPGRGWAFRPSLLSHHEGEAPASSKQLAQPQSHPSQV